MSQFEAWYEADTRFIAGHYQPAALIDLALSRDIDSHRLLRGTGLFYDDILAGTTRLSPQQFFSLIANARRLLDADDSSFLLGQRLLPGHYGPASHALQQAPNLQHALQTVIHHRALLSPLLTPRLLLDEKYAYVYWLDSSGAQEQLRFVLEASMTALLAMSQWLSGERLPWECHFSHAEPRYVEQYWVHLGENSQFGCQLDLMRIPREYLTRPWPNASAIARQVSLQLARNELNALGFSASLIDRLYVYLRNHAQHAPSLELTAQNFGMSQATLKRKLSKHGTHFQAQQDQARKHMALYLYQIKGMSNEDVAQSLNFSAPANFRRSLKRWTGCTPTLIRQLFS